MKSFKKFLNKRVLSVSALAKKHGVDTAYIEKQLKRGIAVEHEHTSKLKVARQITLAHLSEDPDYYKKLKKIEKKTIHEGTYHLPDHIIHAVYDLRRQGYGPYTTAAKIRDEHNLGDYSPKTLDAAAEDAKERFPDRYHPRNSSTKRQLWKRKNIDVDKIRHYRENLGLTFKAIAPRVGIHKEYVRQKYNSLPDSKVNPETHRPRNDHDTVSAIIGLSHKGHSAGSIAEFLGHSKNKVIGVLNRTDPKKREDIIRGLNDNPPKEYLEHKDKPVVVKKGGRPSWKGTKKMTEERMSRILEIIKEAKKEPTDHPHEQAKVLYRMLEKHADSVKKTFDGAHPEVQDMVNAYLERIEHVQNRANKVGARVKKPKRKMGF
jgi:hypothetical protein